LESRFELAVQVGLGVLVVLGALVDPGDPADLVALGALDDPEGQAFLEGFSERIAVEVE
jgi:hypothetical protein